MARRYFVPVILRQSDKWAEQTGGGREGDGGLGLRILKICAHAFEMLSVPSPRKTLILLGGLGNKFYFRSHFMRTA